MMQKGPGTLLGMAETCAGKGESLMELAGPGLTGVSDRMEAMVKQEGSLYDKVNSSVNLIETRTDSQMGLDLNLNSSASLFWDLERFLKRLKRTFQSLSKARAEGEIKLG